MALQCARCGTQNPDGNAFCQSCGNPLAAAPASVPASGPPPGPPPGFPPGPPAGPPHGPPAGPPPGPPQGMAPPTFASPPGYASPYYTPTGATAPIHRTPWMLIIAGVVALIVLMAGCGTALAVLGSRNGTSTGGGGIADVPSPSPATTPSPVVSPTSVPSGPAASSNDGVSVALPAGWSVVNKDNETLVLADPNNEGNVTVASGASAPAQTAQDNKSSIDTELKNKYPDTRNCPGTTTTNGTFNGAKGISWTLCLTLTDGVHSVAAAASIFAGANSSGSVYYIVIVITRQDNLNHYLGVAKPVLAAVHWKLS